MEMGQSPSPWHAVLGAQRDCLPHQHPERTGEADVHEGASLPDPHQLFNDRLEGTKARAIDIWEGDKPNADDLRALIRAGVEHNLAKAKPARNKKSDE